MISFKGTSNGKRYNVEVETDSGELFFKLLNILTDAKIADEAEEAKTPIGCSSVQRK